MVLNLADCSIGLAFLAFFLWHATNYHVAQMELVIPTKLGAKSLIYSGVAGLYPAFSAPAGLDLLWFGLHFIRPSISS